MLYNYIRSQIENQEKKKKRESHSVFVVDSKSRLLYEASAAILQLNEISCASVHNF